MTAPQEQNRRPAGRRVVVVGMILSALAISVFLLSRPDGSPGATQAAETTPATVADTPDRSFEDRVADDSIPSLSQSRAPGLEAESQSLIAEYTTVTEASPETTTAPSPGTTPAVPSTTTTNRAPTVQTQGVLVRPGDNLASIAANHPPGTRYVLAAGTHIVNGVRPENGDSIVGQAGAIVSGGDTHEAAFVGPATGVTISNLIVERYASPPQKAAIHPSGNGWRIEGNEIRDNHGAGVWVTSHSVVTGNSIHHNRQIGLLANGARSAVVENNEIAFNNYANEYAMEWEAGGTKFINTVGLIVKKNFVHHNQGPGLWTDANNTGTIYDSNTVIDNAGPGIFHEISYSATIINNRVEGNAFDFYRGGILVANSSNVEVRGNTVRGNDGGILGIHDNRGEFELRNLHVHDNIISHGVGWTGIRQNINDNVVYSWGHRFEANVYESDPTKRLWYWFNTEKTLAEWQALGHG